MNPLATHPCHYYGVPNAIRHLSTRFPTTTTFLARTPFKDRTIISTTTTTTTTTSTTTTIRPAHTPFKDRTLTTSPTTTSTRPARTPFKDRTLTSSSAAPSATATQPSLPHYTTNFTTGFYAVESNKAHDACLDPSGELKEALEKGSFAFVSRSFYRTHNGLPSLCGQTVTVTPLLRLASQRVPENFTVVGGFEGTYESDWLATPWRSSALANHPFGVVVNFTFPALKL
ncbi:hypothetical protein JCM8547_005192 [Rhodosporidiobolus lusitaniae]